MEQINDRDVAARRSLVDPVWWIREILGDKPWKKQREIIDAVRKYPRVAVRSCHGAGKSWLAARIALWFSCCHRPSIVATTAPTFRQVKRIIWQEIATAHANARMIPGGQLLQTELNHEPGWFAMGFSTDNAQSVVGLHSEHVLVIIDEAAGVPRDIWTGIDGLLSGKHARLLSIGNPTDPTSAFADEFKSPATKTIHISAFDTPSYTDEPEVPGLVTKEWVDDKKIRWGEESPLYLARVLGEFPQNADDTLISLAWIEAAQQRELLRGEPSDLAVDVARYGGDETVIMHREADVIRCVYSTREADTMECTGAVIKALRETQAAIAKIDSIGVGAGVVDRLREQKIPIEEANAGLAPIDRERFANSRAEWYWHLRERFERGDIDIDPNDSDLASQLASVKYKIDSHGRIIMERKEDMKRRGLPSPDRADAVAIAFSNKAGRGMPMIEIGMPGGFTGNIWKDLS